VTSTPTSPVSVNLTALPTRIEQDLASRPGSPASVAGTSGAMRHDSSSPFSGPRREQLDAVFDGVADGERHVLEREPARFDLRDVEDVVDDRHQRLGRLRAVRR
jgi:hypothetical protein